MILLSENERIELTSIIGAYLNTHGIPVPDEPKYFALVQTHLESLFAELDKKL